MRRREFMALLGGAAVTRPLSARAQPASMPVIGYFGAASPEQWADRLGAFRQGLGEAGYVDGRNVTIDYRWADSRPDRLKGDPLTNSLRTTVIDQANRLRLPTVAELADFGPSGALMTYGANTHDMYRRAAEYVDKILKGTSPRDLPIEQPTRFQLVVNLKTAKALGLTIPSSVLATADEVIE